MQIPNANIDILPNGIRLVTEEIPHLRSASVGFVVGTGSCNEPKDIMGISHFIEHMTFKGTQKRDAFAIAQALDSVGGRLNAFTGKEYTVFYAIVQDKHFDIAADLLSDILLNSLYKKEDVDLERNVVLEEIKMYEDTPDEQIHDLFTSTILHGHNFGNVTLGEESTVRSIDREKILGFMEKHYTPDNLIISVAGNISREKTFSSFSGTFSGLKGKRSDGISPVPAIEQRIFLKQKKTEQAHLILGTKGTSQTDDDRFAFSVLDNAIGGSMSSRMFQEIREKRALAYSIYSYNQGFRDIGLFGVYAGTRKENLQNVIGLILKELSDIKKNGINMEEMERGKENLKGSLVLSLESSNSRMNYIAKSLFYYDRIIPIDEICEKIDSVMMDDIVRLANTSFVNKYMNLVVIGDMDSLPVKEINI